MLEPSQERLPVHHRIGQERPQLEHSQIDERMWDIARDPALIERPFYQVLVILCYLALTAAAILEFIAALEGEKGDAWLIPLGLCLMVCASAPLLNFWARNVATTRGLLVGASFLAGMVLTIMSHVTGWYLRYGGGSEAGVAPLLFTATGFWAVLLTGWLAGQLVEAGREPGT